MASEDEGRIRYEILDPERDLAGRFPTNRGLAALPVREPVTFFSISKGRAAAGRSRGTRGHQGFRRTLQDSDLADVGIPFSSSLRTLRKFYRSDLLHRQSPYSTGCQPGSAWHCDLVVHTYRLIEREISTASPSLLTGDPHGYRGSVRFRSYQRLWEANPALL